MKSVIAQGASVAKAIEEALKKAEQPQEFFVKLLEDAQPGFLGFGSKKAKIALFFKEDPLFKKHDGLFEKGSYENLFNNQAMKKQIEAQLKELGLEIQPIKKNQPEKQQPVHQRNNNTPMRMETRPLQNKQPRVMHPQKQQNNMINTSSDVQNVALNSNDDQTQNQSGQQRRKRRARYYQNRSQHGSYQRNQENGPVKDPNKPFKNEQ